MARCYGYSTSHDANYAESQGEEVGPLAAMQRCMANETVKRLRRAILASNQPSTLAYDIVDRLTNLYSHDTLRKLTVDQIVTVKRALRVAYEAGVETGRNED